MILPINMKKIERKKINSFVRPNGAATEGFNHDEKLILIKFNII